MDGDGETLANLLREERRFPPPPEMAAAANAGEDAFRAADADGDAFWAAAAARLEWAEPWTQVRDWSRAPFARWFTGGRLNVAANCLDRHVRDGRGDRVAFHWEGEPGDTRTLTYADLKDEVCRAANALLELGVRAGDRVALYMPMIPETVVAMLACARIGAPHTVVFGGFSAEALRGRILDCDARVVVTADGGYRKGAASALKPAVDEALEQCPDVRSVLVVRRTGQDVGWTDGRDVWWHDLVGAQPAEHEPEAFDAEHPLYIMYTSGTTARPKGILHTTGGYLTQVAWSHWAVFDIKPEQDVYWTAADIGWVTGHSYIVYGPLANGVTSVLYEGTPDTPHQGRWWEIVQKYGVTILYCAPTAIRTFMKWGEEIPGRFDLSSLRLLGSVGEPINPEAWMWYRHAIGSDRCPVVDTWWQTETGAHMISPLPGAATLKPGSALRALPGIRAEVVDDTGKPVPNGSGGYLVLTEPWPSMLRTIWGDEQRYIDTYWSRFPGYYFAGDGAKKDEDGDIWLLGRVDDVMNVSGHRISTTEVESALVSHPRVAEAAVVGAADATTGQGIVAFVILRGDGGGDTPDGELAAKLRAHVAKEIGPIARPRQILVVGELPKTRSGKIMRRLLRDIAENRPLGDVTTLTDSSVMDAIRDGLPAAADGDG
ncbi:acetate--CoA ligase [Actinacidiphila rubida]|uniref:Acetyl-coenzyme A synthetase n=1 Tax=Actinacidiphila rubida TaxID=310780 RepID=A0A1H8FR76_9ACTN|nr:acetate--CoA ligase [Actinacidiphila rubida]SEN34301.1 acetyl-coenzyme A synthetase [Actinacidiphila rubida]